jgi:hypothetical protein
MKSYVEVFKDICAKLDGSNYAVVKKESIQPVYLFNIVKRSTNGRLNKVVGIGFTLDEAKQWIGRKLNQAKEKDSTVIFYDIVNQENKAELDPLWNPRPFFVGGVL